MFAGVLRRPSGHFCCDHPLTGAPMFCVSDRAGSTVAVLGDLCGQLTESMQLICIPPPPKLKDDRAGALLHKVLNLAPQKRLLGRCGGPRKHGL